jgi:hypothetical protein
MRKTLQKASVWAFSALFGCISLLGTGWHCYLGHAFHGPACHPATACHEHAHEHACSDEHETPADDHGQPSGERGPALTAVHDCPLCQFFAQAQCGAEFSPAQSECAACGVPVLAEQAGFVACLGLYQSRAPPRLPA